MDAAYITLLVMCIAMISFMANAASIVVTSMAIPIILALTGVISPEDAFMGFADTNVILFGSMFIIGGALFKTGVAERVGNYVICLTNGSEKKLLVGIWLVVSVTSAFLSNTGCAAVLLPICMGIAESTGWNKKNIMLVLAYTASTGGMITLIGTPPNITVNALLQQNGLGTFGFFEFAWIGIPINLICGLWMFITFKESKTQIQPETRINLIPENIKKPLTRDEIIAIIIMIIVIVVMATGLYPLYIISSIGAIVCLATGILTEKEAVEAVDWTTIFLFAGTLVLAGAMADSGAGKIIAETVVSIIGDNSSAILIMSVIFLITAVLTQIMSNTAICALMAPIGLQIAEVLGVNPKAILIVIAVSASSAFATPMATPPNTLVMGPGNLEMGDFLKKGIPLIVISYILCILIIPMVWPLYV